MERAWKVLTRAGVPLGAARPRPAPRDLDGPGLRRALDEVTRAPARLDEQERVALLAWLRAFRAYWPRAFRRVLGAAGVRAVARLTPAAERDDPNHYLKLRRIALDNLSTAA